MAMLNNLEIVLLVMNVTREWMGYFEEWKSRVQ